MESISVVGVGKLGLCLALNLERKGFSVVGHDIDENYISILNSKELESEEPMVSNLLNSSKNITFTSDMSEVVKNDVIFVVVKTPSTDDWKYDHSQIDSVAKELIKLGPQLRRKELVINSTTFPGYCDLLQDMLIDFNYRVSYNPEFIAQGSIISDQVNCDSVLIGEADVYSGNIISSIYERMCYSNPKINRMNRKEAELCKLSINCFLTTKISFANMIGDIADRLECDKFKVLEAVGNDSRIGNKYLKPGFGFGGPCFPRDNRALLKCAESVGIEAVISKSTDIMNEKHLQYQIDYFVEKNPDKEKDVLIEYVTYKKESTILEESQQLKFALALKKLGYKVIILDEREEVRSKIRNII